MIRRALLFIVIAIIVYFAVQGGQYGTFDLWKQRREKSALTRANDSLARMVDSLRRYRTQLDTDPALQEKLVRENIGMVRDKELVYQLGPPDSAKKGAKKP
jgi:cell division protein FtsB